jgi:anti-sigma regulatory factor (Ser/Thr protein kinase)
MTTVRVRGEAVRRFIIDHVEKHPSNIVRVTSEKFDCTRQAVHKHIARLNAEGAISVAGSPRRKVYSLAAQVKWRKEYLLAPGLTEDQVWRENIAPSLGKLPDNVLSIWQYGFTEMFNNAIDHSGGRTVIVEFTKTAAFTEVKLLDDGVGIFRKIKSAMSLLDERHAVLELAKGKFTTDPRNHSGEGIFFTSRMFDGFEILSGDVYFSHEFDKPEDWIVQRPKPTDGTAVFMKLHNHTSRTTRKVFDKFASPDDYGFTKTVVPVKLMRYGDDNLVSRSQARRLLARIEKFKTVVLDFSGVSSVGQAFADEVFRVFTNAHPEVELLSIHMNSEVKRMVTRAQSLKDSEAT